MFIPWKSVFFFANISCYIIVIKLITIILDRIKPNSPSRDLNQSKRISVRVKLLIAPTIFGGSSSIAIT